jgi:hypothetical protein
VTRWLGLVGIACVRCLELFTRLPRDPRMDRRYSAETQMLVLLEEADGHLTARDAARWERIVVHLCANQLDRKLAGGVSPDTNALLALRAGLLVRPAVRYAFARTVAVLLAEACGSAPRVGRSVGADPPGQRAWRFGCDVGFGRAATYARSAAGMRNSSSASSPDRRVGPPLPLRQFGATARRRGASRPGAGGAQRLTNKVVPAEER